MQTLKHCGRDLRQHQKEDRRRRYLKRGNRFCLSSRLYFKYADYQPVGNREDGAKPNNGDYQRNKGGRGDDGSDLFDLSRRPLCCELLCDRPTDAEIKRICDKTQHKRIDTVIHMSKRSNNYPRYDQSQEQRKDPGRETVDYISQDAPVVLRFSHDLSASESV